MVGTLGCTVDQLRGSYSVHAAGGRYSVRDFQRAEETLLLIGALVLAANRIELSSFGRDLAASEDDQAARLMHVADAGRDDAESSPDGGQGRLFDDSFRRLLGAAGERIVLRELRAQLISIGRHDLALGVDRVSLGTTPWDTTSSLRAQAALRGTSR